MTLIDTGPLVALCDPRDAKHRAAARDLTRLASQPFALCEAVLAEACFHLPYEAQRQRLRVLLLGLDVQMLPLAADWWQVLGWMAKYKDQQPDYADGCLAVLASQHAKIAVWTYDREFRTTWRRLDGRAIPLAVR